MPHAITFERHKLNQAMYQKLKTFIMNKRKREAEERAQDDYYKRIKKEREEKHRQTKFYTDSLECTKREIIETRRKVDALKTEKNVLFQRFKQITHEGEAKREKAKRLLVEKTVPFSEQFQGRPSQEALLLLANMPNRAFGTSYTNEGINPTHLGKTVGQFRNLNQFSQSTHHDQTAVAAAANASNLMGMDKRQLALLFPPKNEQQQSQGNNSKQASVDSVAAAASLFAAAAAAQSGTGGGQTSSSMADAVSQQELSNLSKCLLEYTTAMGGGKLQAADLMNAANANPLTAFLNNAKLTSVNALNTTGGGRSNPHNCGSTPTSTFLPPAPTSYRGSITTGQSAQQIHLQQLAQQQQQVHFNSSNQNQQRQQHEYVSESHHQGGR